MVFLGVQYLERVVEPLARMEHSHRRTPLHFGFGLLLGKYGGGAAAACASRSVLASAGATPRGLLARTTIPESVRCPLDTSGTSMNWLADPTFSVAESRTADRS